jgi:hypothetical protein
MLIIIHLIRIELIIFIFIFIFYFFCLGAAAWPWGNAKAFTLGNVAHGNETPATPLAVEHGGLCERDGRACLGHHCALRCSAVRPMSFGTVRISGIGDGYLGNKVCCPRVLNITPENTKRGRKMTPS